MQIIHKMQVPAMLLALELVVAPQQILDVPQTQVHHIHKPIIPKCHATHPKRVTIPLIAK